MAAQLTADVSASQELTEKSSNLLFTATFLNGTEHSTEHGLAPFAEQVDGNASLLKDFKCVRVSRLKVLS